MHDRRALKEAGLQQHPGGGSAILRRYRWPCVSEWSGGRSCRFSTKPGWTVRGRDAHSGSSLLQSMQECASRRPASDGTWHIRRAHCDRPPESSLPSESLARTQERCKRVSSSRMCRHLSRCLSSDAMHEPARRQARREGVHREEKKSRRVAMVSVVGHDIGHPDRPIGKSFACPAMSYPQLHARLLSFPRHTPLLPIKYHSDASQ